MGNFKTLTLKQQKISLLIPLLVMLMWVLGGSYLAGRFSCSYSYDFTMCVVIISALPLFFALMSFFVACFSKISEKDQKWLKGGEI